MKNLRCAFRAEVTSLKNFVYEVSDTVPGGSNVESGRPKQDTNEDPAKQVMDALATGWKSMNEVSPEVKKIRECAQKANLFIKLAKEYGVNTKDTNTYTAREVTIRNDVQLNEYLIGMAKTLNQHSNTWGDFYNALATENMLSFINNAVVLNEFNEQSKKSNDTEREKYVNTQKRNADNAAREAARKNAPKEDWEKTAENAFAAVGEFLTPNPEAQKAAQEVAERINLVKKFYDAAEANGVSTTDTYKLRIELNKKNDGSLRNPSRVTTEYEFARYMRELAKTLDRSDKGWKDFYANNAEFRNILDSHEVLIADEASLRMIQETENMQKVEAGLMAFSKYFRTGDITTQSKQNHEVHLLADRLKTTTLEDSKKMVVNLLNATRDNLPTGSNALASLLTTLSDGVNRSGSQAEFAAAVNVLTGLKAETQTTTRGVAEVAAGEVEGAKTTITPKARAKNAAAERPTTQPGTPQAPAPTAGESGTPVRAIAADRPTRAPRTTTETGVNTVDKSAEKSSKFINYNIPDTTDRQKVVNLINGNEENYHLFVDPKTMHSRVIALQQNINKELKSRGTHIREDGEFGPLTFAALKDTTIWKKAVPEIIDRPTNTETILRLDTVELKNDIPQTVAERVRIIVKKENIYTFPAGIFGDNPAMTVEVKPQIIAKNGEGFINYIDINGEPHEQKLPGTFNDSRDVASLYPLHKANDQTAESYISHLVHVTVNAEMLTTAKNEAAKRNINNYNGAEYYVEIPKGTPRTFISSEGVLLDQDPMPTNLIVSVLGKNDNYTKIGLSDGTISYIANEKLADKDFGTKKDFARYFEKKENPSV